MNQYLYLNGTMGPYDKTISFLCINGLILPSWFYNTKDKYNDSEIIDCSIKISIKT
jgi:hypothetical protein